jgi:hypothetical protein
MTNFVTTCGWGRLRPSRSRTQVAAFGGAKGKAEDEEMRSAAGVIQACVVGGLVIQ